MAFFLEKIENKFKKHKNNYKLQGLIVFSALVIWVFAKALWPSGFRHEKIIFQKTSANQVQAQDLSHLKIEKAIEKPFPRSLEISAKLTIPDKDIFIVSSRVTGRLESLKAAVGDSVTGGAALGTIWSPDFATAVEELTIAQGQKNSSLIQLTVKKIDSMGIRMEDIKNGATTVFPIRSPINGVVLDRKMNAGASLQVGDQILVLGRLGAMQLQADILSEQSLLIKNGMKVMLDEFPEAEAQVVSVSPIVDANTRLIKLKADITKNFAQKVPQETLLKARVVLEIKNSLVLPLKALIRDSENEFIMVQSKSDPSLFSKVKVVVRDRLADEMMIDSNPDVDANSMVVSEGALLLERYLSDEEAD